MASNEYSLAWRKVVASVLGGKASMKEGKMKRKCVKQARQVPVLSALTKAEASDSLAAFLAR